jgi:hypothetical protein
MECGLVGDKTMNDGGSVALVSYPAPADRLPSDDPDQPRRGRPADATRAAGDQHRLSDQRPVQHLFHVHAPSAYLGANDPVVMELRRTSGPRGDEFRCYDRAVSSSVAGLALALI